MKLTIKNLIDLVQVNPPIAYTFSIQVYQHVKCSRHVYISTYRQQQQQQQQQK